mmetsp:Transcript_3763/g.7166  ORF Transcript_3763/g.7166 Transcript_3763/m.7166 type:complete len:242 (-) Transcript_3763:1340-2065(-)
MPGKSGGAVVNHSQQVPVPHHRHNRGFHRKDKLLNVAVGYDTNVLLAGRHGHPCVTNGQSDRVLSGWQEHSPVTRRPGVQRLVEDGGRPSPVLLCCLSHGSEDGAVLPNRSQCKVVMVPHAHNFVLSLVCWVDLNRMVRGLLLRRDVSHIVPDQVSFLLFHRGRGWLEGLLRLKQVCKCAGVNVDSGFRFRLLWSVPLCQGLQQSLTRSTVLVKPSLDRVVLTLGLGSESVKLGIHGTHFV